MKDYSQLSRAEKIRLAKQLLQQKNHAAVAQKFPMSPHQQRLWFLSQFEQASIAYNQRMVLNIEGNVNTDSIKKSIHLLHHRHAAFRTKLVSDGGVACQIILPKVDVDFAILEAADSGEGKREAIIQDIVSKPFELAQAPLSRFRLVRWDEHRSTLVIVIHHIVTDSFSMDVIRNELIGAYKAYSQGVEPLLPAQTYHYGDYAEYLDTLIRSGELEKQWQYFECKLDALPPVMELNYDFPRPSSKRYVGKRAHIELDKGLTLRVTQAAKQAGVTKFMYLLACFKITLAAIGGQQDIVVGTTIANREKAEFQNLVGLLVNSLVLRTPLDWKDSFAAFLQQVKATCVEAYANADLPFNELVDRLNPVRTQSYSPLFQVMFTFHGNKSNANVPEEGLSIVPTDSQFQSSIFDMTLDLVERERGMIGHIEYDTDLFKHQSINTVIEVFKLVVEQSVIYEQLLLNQFNLVDEVKYNQDLKLLNNTHTPCSQHSVLHQIEQQSQLTPTAIATEDADGNRMSYAQLWENSERVALHLAAMKIGVGDVVAVKMTRGCHLIVTLLGILRAGAAYLPLELSLPEGRHAHMLDNSQACLVITDSNDFASTLPVDIAKQPYCKLLEAPVGGELIQLDRINTARAYVIYTSGSTGKPKGVEVTHDALQNRLNWMQNYSPIDAHDRVLQKTPFGFDVSVWELFWPLMYGARLVFAKHDGHLDFYHLQQYIHERQITTLHFVPAMLNAAISMIDRQLWTSVKRVFCSGEALEKATVAAFYETEIDAQLHNLYGPTEACIDVSYFACTDYQKFPSVPIGKPIDNVFFLVLSTEGQALPQGVPGELYIGGAGLATGYINNQTLTDERFVTLDYLGVPTRFYKTGDLVKWSHEGELLYIGRLDNQIKLNGFRIECGEIELQLVHPEVIAAQVLIRDIEGVKRLCAFVVHQSNDKDAQRQCEQVLKDQLSQVLPKYMLPELYVWLDDMPITTNGKLDRKSLISLPISNIESTPQRLPITEVEVKTVDMIAKLLAIEPDRVDLHASFFQYGNSLKAMMLIAHLNEHFELSLTIQAVLEQDSLLALTDQISTLVEQTKSEEVEYETFDF
ncbi:hypothetical protein N480_19185 [Pseudoalteromonas luteoviolacea S2607]|uniref:non-ribosomal peptide synthetase n=1 Tax=Pseudoalteromonas luteoviolacea TaxID=43657 RepID=UPI0007B07F58|nr:non-ribosomal peptide synthetase [Pseudoalteromonas luteoviolacea]KZN35310.1 hypothetical protein N480_19185 [Pseudoalteromonas luteoviolacea S2607]